ncbi:MAG TPA: PleD family two-component system response regulator [Acetobacteraceae bacterium]|nr:PleD family two-component system response regulator [Acetobacteraceae bacterium]
MTARILIVDDVPANVRLLEAKLAAEYYQVAAARDGVEALALARRWQPDLILLDVMMPGMDGLECCRRLKRDADTAHIPVIMVTALHALAERMAALELGADDFLTKPVEIGTLMARVRSLVRLKRLLDEWRARCGTARALGLDDGCEEPPAAMGACALVVTDDEAQAGLALRALEHEGIMARQDRSGVELAADGGGLDLVVLSLSLRSDDPLRLASRLRAAEGTQHVPLLLIADPDQPGLSLRAFELGANDWVSEPICENELRVRARNQVRRKRYQDRLRAELGHALELAATDPLTGLYNRRYLIHHLRGLLRATPPGDVSLLMIDVDRFKHLNDALGHVIGDRALQAVAATLRGNTRAFDTLSRIGGEEFVVVMPGTSAAEATAAAERLRQAVEDLDGDFNQGRLGGLTVSIGIARSSHSAEPDALLRAADAALYEAKRAGRNRIHFAEGTPDRSLVLAECRKAAT